jgi:membrane-associated phospholipid phosphatase
MHRITDSPITRNARRKEAPMRTGRIRTAAGLAVVAIGLLACTDVPTAPAPAPARPALSAAPLSPGISSPKWQQRARSLVGANNQSPIAAGRTYAAVSIAQYRAVLAAEKQLSNEGALPQNGMPVGGTSRYEALRGAVAGASVRVLSFLYPSAAAALEQQLAAEGSAGPGGVHPSFARGVATGRATGDQMVTHLISDGSSLPPSIPVPVGPGLWIPGGPPAGHNLPGVKPYFLISTSQFRSPPPPAFLSPAFNTDLNEVLAVSQTRTAQQIALAHFWNSPAGTRTPLGIWNEVAATYIQQAGLDERAATHVFALMHGAQFDAQLGCWDSKFFYFTIRPHQANPAITTVFATPNHPSYPSGHSCISSSSARVLEYFFPQRAAELASMVADAGLSRLYAGIHYRFDIDAGKTLGVEVANWAIAKDQAAP